MPPKVPRMPPEAPRAPLLCPRRKRSSRAGGGDGGSAPAPFFGAGELLGGAQSSEKRGCSRTLPLGMATTGLRPGLAQGTWALTKKKGTWLIFPVDQHCRRHEQRSAPPSQTPPWRSRMSPRAPQNPNKRRFPRPLPTRGHFGDTFGDVFNPVLQPLRYSQRCRRRWQRGPPLTTVRRAPCWKQGWKAMSWGCASCSPRRNPLPGEGKPRSAPPQGPK